MFIAVSAVQVWASDLPRRPDRMVPAADGAQPRPARLPGANFGSIAMQPFAHIAGAASSVQAFFRMFGAAMVGC
jgi:MFS transporter, DHA1 family, multidrug resistance protein